MRNYDEFIKEAMYCGNNPVRSAVERAKIRVRIAGVKTRMVPAKIKANMILKKYKKEEQNEQNNQNGATATAPHQEA